MESRIHEPIHFSSLVNPHLVKTNKENRDNTPSKSDHKDALVIADIVKNGYSSSIRFHPEDYEELRILMANREAGNLSGYTHGNALLRHAG